MEEVDSNVQCTMYNKYKTDILICITYLIFLGARLEAAASCAMQSEMLCLVSPPVCIIVPT